MASLAKPRANRGFTLIELLVVIAIIGVLVGLLLPAVQQAREAARRTTCVNNMKQLGIACHNYKDVNKVLPPGWQKPTDLTNFSEGNYWGWGTFILPFMEETSLFDQIDFTAEYTVSSGGPNDGISANILTGYLCPSDASGPMGIEYVNHAKSNYIGSYGNKQIDLPANWSSTANRGVFTENRALKFRHITDGTSKTILLGERTGTPRNGSNYKAGLWAGPRLLNNNIKRPEMAVGRGPGSSADLGNTVNGTSGWTLSVSDHPGGANVAKVDGSVAFLNDSINIDAYRWMIQIDDGQPIPN